MLRLNKRLLLVVALLAVGGAAVGIAYATIPSGGVINGCYQKNNGTLRVIGTNPTVGGGACSNGEQALNWNQVGPTGATGPAGATGTAGASGATGATGASGAPGISGYAIYTSDTLVPAGNGAFAFSTCPAGKVALGGGYLFVNSGDSQFVHVTQSLPAKPTFGFDAWLVIMDIPSGEHLIRVYAICADANVG